MNNEKNKDLVGTEPRKLSYTKFIDHCNNMINNADDEQFEKLYDTKITITMCGRTLELPFDAVAYNMIIDGLEANKDDLMIINSIELSEEMFTKVNTLTFIDDVEQLATILDDIGIGGEKAEILAGKKVGFKLVDETLNNKAKYFTTLNNTVKYFTIKSKRKDIQYIVKTGFVFRENCFKEYQKDEDM